MKLESHLFLARGSPLCDETRSLATSVERALKSWFGPLYRQPDHERMGQQAVLSTKSGSVCRIKGEIPHLQGKKRIAMVTERKGRGRGFASMDPNKQREIAAQEAKRPQKDMPFGILGSLAICTVL